MLRGLGCFLGIKWAVAVPIFTLFHFFLLQTYFYAKSHLLSILKSKKSDRWRKKCDQSTPALKQVETPRWKGTYTRATRPCRLRSPAAASQVLDHSSQAIIVIRFCHKLSQIQNVTATRILLAATPTSAHASAPATSGRLHWLIVKIKRKITPRPSSCFNTKLSMLNNWAFYARPSCLKLNGLLLSVRNEHHPRSKS